MNIYQDSDLMNIFTDSDLKTIIYQVHSAELILNEIL